MPAHEFEARLAWKAGGTSTHRVEVPGKQPFEVSAAPQYRGDASRLNPEELFVAAVASCQLLTYLALAARAGVSVLAYEDRATGTLALAERRMRMTRVVLRPRITVGAGSDPARARALVDSAHEGCFIASSVSCPVDVEPEILAG